MPIAKVTQHSSRGCVFRDWSPSSPCECQRKGFFYLGVMPLPLNFPWRIFGQCVGTRRSDEPAAAEGMWNYNQRRSQLLHLLDQPLDESRCEDLLAATVGIVSLPFWFLSVLSSSKAARTTFQKGCLPLWLRTSPAIFFHDFLSCLRLTSTLSNISMLQP